MRKGGKEREIDREGRRDRVRERLDNCILKKEMP